VTAKKTEKLVNLADLRPTPNNPRTHSDEQIQRIAGSIQRFGWTNPMLLAQSMDEPGAWQILAGHGRMAAAIQLGIEEVPYRDLTHLSEADRLAYVIADNKLAEDAGWHDDSLALIFEELNAAGVPLDSTGFDIEAANEIMKAARKHVGDSDGNGGQEGEDDFGEVADKPISRPGDLWHLGPHRLYIGDSMKPADLDTLASDDQVHLIATDPPYAIYGSSTGMASDISDDKMVRPFFERVADIAAKRLPWFGHAYVFCDWRSWAAIWSAVQSTPSLEPKNLLIWDKGGSGLGSNYSMTYEMMGFFHKLPKQKAMGNRPAGMKLVHKPNILRHQRPHGKDREHNAAKPVALMRELIENSTGPGDVVLDPFCGSGSTLIAADQLDRICFTMEIEPGWADVTLNRFWRLRETEPELVQCTDDALAGGVATYSQVVAHRRGEYSTNKK
jgi:DNA modification methylase